MAQQVLSVKASRGARESEGMMEVFVASVSMRPAWNTRQTLVSGCRTRGSNLKGALKFSALERAPPSRARAGGSRAVLDDHGKSCSIWLYPRPQASASSAAPRLTIAGDGQVQVGELGLSYGAQRSSFSVDRRSSWRGKALLICSGVAMVALLCFVGLDRSSSKGFDRASLGEASNEGMNGGTSGKTAHNGDASDFIDTADLGDYVDAIIGPAPSGLTDGGYKKRGSLAVSKIDAAGFYYLNVEGEPGHALKCILQGSDGYHRHWKGYGQVYTGPIHEGKYGGKDYLQIQDLVTGEVEYFRFRFT